ncbi:MAG: class I SAM-dependent methyltransferase [Candidatus Omnitrophica bacterium]|nr:class I SAM-dependent methyltransferase [Candidatus Omnitrophota bacterium]
MRKLGRFDIKTEIFRPPSNLPPGKNIQSRIRYFLRSHIDLVVLSVLRNLRPWLVHCSGKVLEVGAGLQPYRHLIPVSCEYQAIDHAISKEFDYQTPDTLYYQGDIFPVSSDSVDFLFHTEVLEHVFDVTRFLSECHRVLKKGGSMFFSVPFQYRYHYIPYDYWRMTPSALQIVLEQIGFKNISIIPRGTDITVVAHKMLIIIFRWLKGGLVAKTFGLLCLPMAMVILLVGHISLLMGIGSRDDCIGFNVITQKSQEV